MKHLGSQWPWAFEAIHGEVTIATRCALRETPLTDAANLTIHCPDSDRCLADNLDCAFDPSRCPFPVGWSAHCLLACHGASHGTGHRCVPKPAADAFTAHYRKALASFKSGAAAVGADAECSGHGAGSCACDHGYTGPHCSQGLPPFPCPACLLGTIGITEIDFCAGQWEGPGIRQSACGPHGLCQSSPAGIACLCRPGWSGALCDERKAFFGMGFLLLGWLID